MDRLKLLARSCEQDVGRLFLDRRPVNVFDEIIISVALIDKTFPYIVRLAQHATRERHPLLYDMDCREWFYDEVLALGQVSSFELKFDLRLLAA